jgi:hypothetical protein
MGLTRREAVQRRLAAIEKLPISEDDKSIAIHRLNDDQRKKLVPDEMLIPPSLEDYLAEINQEYDLKLKNAKHS